MNENKTMAKDDSGLYVAALGAIIFGCFIGMSDTALPAVGDRNSEADRQTDSNNETNIEINNQEALGNDSCIDKKQCELHNDRYSHVLQNIIHKKVLSKSSNTKSKLRRNPEDLILPHEQELSSRSLSIRNKHSSVSSSWWVKKWYRKKRGRTNFDKKNDIIIQTLRSIRSTLKLSLNDAASLHNSLYSPRTCPICCDDYVKGDDIAWSKNEVCCHAFHTDCIVPWLMEHEECPMCRCDYVRIEHDDDWVDKLCVNNKDNR